MPGRNGRGPKWWHGKIRGCGYRLTIPRQSTLDILSRTSRHLSTEEIYHAIHKIYPSIGLTTVYRNLELLVQMGLVSRFDFGDGRARYEIAQGHKGVEHHHHLVCTQCGKVVNYTDFIEEEVELLNNTEKGLSKKYNFQIKSHMIQFYGLCELCRKR